MRTIREKSSPDKTNCIRALGKTSVDLYGDALFTLVVACCNVHFYHSQCFVGIWHTEHSKLDAKIGQLEVESPSLSPLN